MKQVIPVVLTLLLAAVAHAAAQPSSSVVVRSTIHDSDTGVGPTLHIRSDAISGGSEDYDHRPRYLESIIQSGGDWELDLGLFTTKPSGRRIVLGAFAPASGEFSVIRFITRCRDGGIHNQNILQLLPGVSVPCGLSVEWKDLGDGSTYRLYLNVNKSFSGQSNEDVWVTCTGVAGGLCNQWRIRPQQQVGGVYSSNGTVVKLISNKKGAPTEQVQGSGPFSFSFDIAKP